MNFFICNSHPRTFTNLAVISCGLVMAPPTTALNAPYSKAFVKLT